MAEPHAAAEAGRLRILNIEAGSVRAEIKTLDENKPISSGSPAFIDISIANTGKLPANGRLRLKSENAKLRLLPSEDGGVSVLKETAEINLRGLRPGRNRKYMVEVTFSGAGTGSNAVEVSLDAGASAGSSTRLSWQIADCAQNFYTEISSLSGDRIKRIEDAIQSARSGDRSASRSWVFKPLLRADRVRQRCRRPVRAWSEETQSWQRRCPDAEMTSASPALSKQEQDILSAAGALISAGEADTQLSREVALGEVLSKSFWDLKTYVRQKANPAICTGAGQFVDYYTTRLKGLKERFDRFRSLRQAAEERLQARLAALRSRPVQISPEGKIDATAPAGIVQPVNDAALDLTGAVVETARLAGLAEAAAETITSAANPRFALEAAREALEDRPAEDDALAQEARTIFSFIQAVSVLRAVSERHATLEREMLGSYDDIRKAHETNCKCLS